MIKWKLENAKLYKPLTKIAIEPTSNALEKEGALETERGRKRKRNPNEHKSSIRKEKRARGESYSPRKSKTNENKARLPSKKIGPPCPKTCRKKCSTFIDEEER